MDASGADAVHVLHVEPDPQFRELTETFLERQQDSFTVTAAADADAALDRLDEDVDCIVSDYDLPRQSGIALLEAVRTEHPGLPFVLFTSQGSETVASDAIAAGVTDYLQKGTTPERFELLANRVRNAVSAYESERAAKEHHQRLQQVMKTVPTAITRVDRDGEIVFANERAQSNLGYEPSEVTERTYNDPRWEIRDLDGDPIPDEELPFRQVLQSGEPIEGYRHTIVWPDGERRVVEINGAPLFDDDGAVESVVFSNTDVTAQTERERALQRERDRLDEFASVVSHDLRNPLNVASLSVDIAREECDSERLEMTKDALDRMEQLIDDLLALARTDTGVEDPEWVRLDDLLRRCWRSVETDGAGLQVRTDTRLRGDRSQLKRAFENLFRNAIEHGGDDVTVTVGSLTDVDGLYVADDGDGVSSQAAERLFESGFSTQSSGTGFGLAIVKGIVEAHGWEIRATQSEDGGARFEIVGIGGDR
ncbi:response regulator [Halobellus sp. Atlit-31R]|nr:response regulator [Halobellus sp. Atlit-31R]